jgi:hypothetical protein
MLLYSVSGKRNVHIVHFHKEKKSHTWFSGLVPLYTIKAYGGSRGMYPLIFTLASDGGEY